LVLLCHKMAYGVPRRDHMREGRWNLVWWCTSTIPALRRQKQEDHEFKASVGYIARLSQKTKTAGGVAQVVEYLPSKVKP
jgi:hypothetical protein